MGLVAGLIVLAVVLAVIGLVIRALKWLLILAVALFAAGVVRGVVARRSRSSTSTR